MKRITMLTALTVIATLAAFASVATAGIAVNMNHYQCYKVKGEFEKVPIKLQDQFATELKDAVAIKPVLLCNPTVKVHGTQTFPIDDLSLHYVCYSIKTEKFDKRDVFVNNQLTDFSSVTVTVIKPKMLCVPSSKNEPT